MTANDRKRPILPGTGGGDHRRWWRGTGGVALRIKDRKHLPCPSPMLRMVPPPRWGRNDSPPPQSGPRGTTGSRRTTILAGGRLTNPPHYSIPIPVPYPPFNPKKKGKTAGGKKSVR